MKETRAQLGEGLGEPRRPDHSPPPVDAPRQATLTTLLDTGPGRLGLLLCRVNSDPPAQLRLLHGDHLVASTLQGVEELASSSLRLQVAVAPNTLRLEIHNAALEDEGVYTCQATNTLGQTSASANFDAQGQCGHVSVCMDGSFKRGEEAGEGSGSLRHSRWAEHKDCLHSHPPFKGSNFQTWVSWKNLLYFFIF